MWGSSLDDPEGACYPWLVANPSPYEPISEREITAGRILAAVAYLPALSLIGLLDAPHNRYVRFHARQGLLLFLAEIVGWIALALYDVSIGRIPVFGIVLGASLRFVTGLAFLAVTVYGVFKAASGERMRIPFLADAADQLTI